MQRNQPLSMIKVTETFYAGRIWVYSITFIIYDEKQNKENVHIYIRRQKTNLPLWG